MTDFVGSVHPSADFSMMRNHWFRDPRLSDRAKGRLAYLATHAPGYRLTMEQQIAETKDGRDGVYAALRELVDLGYLERRQARSPDGRLGEAYFTWGPAASVPGYERSWGRSGPASGLARDGKPDDGLTASGEALSGDALSGGDETKKTSSLEDQELEHQPPPEVETAAPVAGALDLGGGGTLPEPQPNPDHLTSARTVLAAAYATSGRQAPPAGMVERLAVQLAARLAAGWSSSDAADHLAGSMASGRTPYAIMKWRIDNNLAGPPPPPRPAPAAPAPAQRRPPCGTCSGDGTVPADPVVREFAGRARQVVRYVPCPDCAEEVAA